MTIEKLTLESPVVQEAKRKFASQRRKCRLSFEELFTRFLQGDTFLSMSIDAGITEQGIRHIWVKNFRARYATVRQRAIEEKLAGYRERVLACREAELPKDSALRIVAEKARRLNCTVEIAPPRSYRMTVRELRINGQLVHIHTTNCIYARRTMELKFYVARRIYDEEMGLKRPRLGIFYAKVDGQFERIFVKTGDDIWEQYFRGNRKERYEITTPLRLRQKNKYKNPRRPSLWACGGIDAWLAIAALRPH